MKTLLTIFSSLFICCSAYAQEHNISVVLTAIWDNMPDSICMLKSEAKIDSVTNNDHFLSATISNTSTIQLSLLENVNNEKIICLIKTFSAPATESIVLYYDKNWNRVGAQTFDFSNFSSESSLQKYFIPTLISAKFNSDKTLTISLSDQNITEEEKKLITFPLQKVLKWNGVNFQ